MKSFFKRLLSRAVQHDYVWTVLDATILKASHYAELKRRSGKEHLLVSAAIEMLFPNLRVAHGPFQGMRYPHAESANSPLFPKLLGSYEKELEQILETICNGGYTEIVDIGCAEGYYAVGLAMRIPSATVYAFDTDERAKAMCEELAELNHVRERLVIRSFCDVEALKSIPFSGRGLILSDCEGYEKRLFTPEAAPFLRRHDLLIEIHDLADIEISSGVREIFKDTHTITAIQSIDDITKAHTYSYEELRGYDLASRKILLAEERAAIQEWFYMTPRPR